jgi:hypothetical protein
MTYEQFQTEVETMIANLTAVAKLGGAGWAFKYHDVSLAVCECAAEISGFDVTFAKMFNRKFREDAVKYAMTAA